MKANGIKCGFAFSRNPIVLQESWPSAPLDKNGGRMVISMGGTDIYEGRFTPPLSVNLSEIVDAYIMPYPEPPAGNTSPLLQVVDMVDMTERMVHCEFAYNDEISTYDFTALPGGVSRQNFRRYLDTDTDAFKARYFNYKGNFFLTTRTSGWRIAMKETELSPLYFYLYGQDDEIVLKELVSGGSMLFERLENGVYILDVDLLRREFLNNCGVLANIFDVYVAGRFSCRIVVECAECSRDRCRVRFRNSLGVFEVMELTGTVKISAQYPDADEAVYERHDAFTDDFSRERERIARRVSLEIDSGVKRSDQLAFLMDMAGSDEVYLLDVADMPVKVIPSVENLEYDFPITAPATFTITLQPVDDEMNIMQEIADGTDSIRPRLFTYHFNNKFN